MTQEPVRGLAMGSYASRGSFRKKDSAAYHNPGWGIPQPWEQEAACQDTPIELWFGEDSQARGKRPFRSKEQTQQAKAICVRCPVLDDCRLWAMESGIPFGLIGMMTEVERQWLADQDQEAWQQFWQRQDKAMGRRKRPGGDHNGNKTHCRNGHPYSLENTYISGGKRYCVACRNIRNKQYQLRKREELGDWLWQKLRQENGHKAG